MSAMTTFRYQAGGAGGAGAGEVEAPDRATALRLLRERGVIPVSLEESVSAAEDKDESEQSGADRAPLVRQGAGTARTGRAMSRADFASFIQELATAIQAGLPLVTALKTVGRGKRNKAAPMVGHLVSEVEHGRSLADAAASWGKPFDQMTVNLVRAGESSGRLGQVMTQASVLLEREVKVKRQVLSATLYPMILLVLVTIAVIVVVTVIVPQVLAPLEGQMSFADLPLPTRIVQGLAEGVRTYWWAILGGLAALVLLGSNLLRAPDVRLVVDTVLLRTPILGRLLRDVAVARFARTMGTLIEAGLPALTALKITKSTLGNMRLEAVVDDVCEQVSGGKTIADPMEASEQFPELLVQIISVGERSGKLGEMLGQAADVFEGRTEQSIKVFTTALPPLLTVVLAVVVGFVIMAVILPLLEMQEFIG